MISMGNALKNILIVCFIAAIWIALEGLDHGLLGLPLISESSYFIYWLSGLRLVAIILFGWLGFFGLFLGYAVCSIYIWGGSDSDALILGFLLSIAPMIAYRYWQSAFDKDDDFDDVNFVQLCYFVFLHSFIAAFFKNVYWYFVGHSYGIDHAAMIFAANVLGSFVFLYLLLFCNRLYKRIKKRPSTKAV